MSIQLYTNAGHSDPGLDNYTDIQPGDMDYCQFYDPTASPIGACSVDWGDGSALVTDPGSSYIVFLTHTYAAAGTYTLVATWPGGSRTVDQIVVPYGPHLYVTPNDGMVGVPVEINGASDYGDSNAFEVDYGDGSAHYFETSSYSVDQHHTYAAVGSYTGSITVTNSRGTATKPFTVSIVAPPPGMTIADAVDISGASGSQEMGPYQGVPELSDSWPGYTESLYWARGDLHGLWVRWTAPTTGIAVFHLATPVGAEPNPWMTAYRASDMLVLNESEGPGVEPWWYGTLGVPVTAGVEYLLVVGSVYDNPDVYVLTWAYAPKVVSGPCFMVPFGFHTDQLVDAVQISDPTKVQTVFWAGSAYTRYVNTMYSNGEDRAYVSPDRLSYEPGSDRFGLGVIDSGRQISQRPSVLISDGLYPDTQATQRGAHPMGFPGTTDVLIIGGADFDDFDIELRRVASSGVTVARWSRPPDMTDGSGTYGSAAALVPGGGPDTFVYYPRLQHGEFIDGFGKVWLLALRQLKHWNGSTWVSIPFDGPDNVIIKITRDLAGTSSLVAYDPGPFTDTCSSLHAFAPIGDEWLASYNSVYAQYETGMWIRRYDSAWNILEEFEWRPYPVVERGSTGDNGDSLPPYNYGEFYAQGYMATVPGDDEHFYMTNNAYEADADISHSFIFKIPKVDSGGDRHAAMRTPWAHWLSNGGEIYNIVYAELPAAGGWAVGRVN